MGGDLYDSADFGWQGGFLLVLRVGAAGTPRRRRSV